MDGLIEGHLPFEHPIEQYQLYSTRNYPDLRELLALAARERENQSIIMKLLTFRLNPIPSGASKVRETLLTNYVDSWGSMSTNYLHGLPGALFPSSLAGGGLAFSSCFRIFFLFSLSWLL